ncbi:MAG: hypothetical protein A2041_13095 [Bacteroidetes bacterium GWA2_31_9b]|nr:MAG: hypothetical protein A2041_13095 [Bacteroidetes bacterium GWA2_31_9b]
MITLKENTIIDSSTINLNSQAGFVSLNIITSACHSVLNTVFVAPDPKPVWFDDLNKELDAAKLVAKKWINDLAPDITAKIPNHVIDYATTYSAMTDQIVALAEKNPTAKGKDNPIVKEIFALIDALSGAVSDIITDVDSMKDKLTAWGDELQAAHDGLVKGAVNIQNLEIELQGDIDNMNNAISNLRAMIDEQNKAICYSAMAVGVGVFLMVVGVGLAPLTGGWSLIVTGVGAVAVVGGAITWGIMQGKINDEFKDIATDQQKITDDKRQIVALQGLSTASDSAISSITLASQALSDVKTMWSFFDGELKGVVDKLNKADEELYAIVNEAYVLGAQKEWNEALKFAEQLVGMQVTVEEKTLSMSA